MNTVLYKMLYGLCYAISLLPLKALYVVSDMAVGLLYHVVRYRRRVVRKNLTTSFPDKSLKEIVRIEKNFYAWLCDYAVETVKLLSISRAEISRRMKFEAVDLLKNSIDNNRSCAVYLGHYCNWEWVTSLPLVVGKKATCMQIYHKLENKVFDSFFLKLRGRMGSESIPMAETLRRILKGRNDGECMVIGFIADQVPFWNNIHYWTNFLNHDTPVFTGTERIARKCGMDVYYMDLKRPRRGYYTAEIKLITTDISKCENFEITERYWRLLEETVESAPCYWLWSHNRWKRNHKEWERRTKQSQHEHHDLISKPY